MATGFQPDAFQSDAFQQEGGLTSSPGNDAFQGFQQDAFQGVGGLLSGVPAVVLDAFQGFQQDAFQGVGGLIGGGAGYSLAGDVGTYTLTGQSATFTFARNFPVSAGSYTLTGQSATLTYARSLTAANATYAINGQDAILTYTPGSGAIAYSLSGDVGFYTITGQTATLVYVSGFVTPQATRDGGHGRWDKLHGKGRKRQLTGEDVYAYLDALKAEFDSNRVKATTDESENVESAAEEVAEKIKQLIPQEAYFALVSNFTKDISHSDILTLNINLMLQDLAKAKEVIKQAIDKKWFWLRNENRTLKLMLFGKIGRSPKGKSIKELSQENEVLKALLFN